MTDPPAAPPSERARAEMLHTNVAQAAYYDVTNGTSVSGVNGLATNLWRRLRARAVGAVSDQARARFYDLHMDWLGDLSGAKVLELGCGTGTPLSRHLADRAASYHAIDLSAVQVRKLARHLGRKNGRPRRNAHFHSGDFLSEDFAVTGFDVIYAHSVFHHFRHLDVLFDRIEAVAKPGALVVTLDPLQTWAPARALRALYRPFQTDADWEYPFDRAALRRIEARFEVLGVVGLFNRARWALVLGMIHPALGRVRGDAWFDADLAPRRSGFDVLAATQISYRLRLRPAPSGTAAPSPIPQV